MWHTIGYGNKGLTCGCISDDFSDRYEACSKDDTHYKKPLARSCNERGCPVCSPKIVYRESVKANERICKIHDEWLKIGYDLGTPHHMILSPGESININDLSPGQYEKYSKQAQKYAEQIGIIGGCQVTHSTRGTKWDYRDMRKGLITENDIKIGLHFHIVGYMPNGHLINSPDFYAQTGWIYKNIPFRVPKVNTSFHVIKYELSHAAFAENKHMLRWFGICAYNNSNVEVKTSNVEAVCHTCKAPIALYTDGLFDSYKIIKKVYRKFTIPLNVVKRLTARYSLKQGIPRGETILAYAI